MSIQIVILGLLEKKAYHPYEMKKVIFENKWDQLFPITDGNLYHAIRKLEKHKWIEAEKEEQVNNRPNRTVYRLTPHGKAQLSKEIYEVFNQRILEPRSLYPALLFIHSADVPEIAGLIKTWIKELKEESDRQNMYEAKIPKLIHEHYRGLNEHYMNWFVTVLEVLEAEES